ncbi:helicase [Companilactobacillus sp. RD055328]|uniref:DEAD/DEAH box helicase n=1 Tax=Companilactobacillus sp. RD055328 TaxID=2916634 RepID=UPI001FC8751E|nr:DEAD/DEAH box helicase [Companilactobacillus sp. RD055328]GKQ43458.1 helicase [Companilactobacillus sp. RD055328]
MGISDDISNSVLAGFIDNQKYDSQTEFAPKLLINSKSEKVKTHIEEELTTCVGFTFAVAFISEAIVTDLKVKFADLVKRGVKGRILTSTYLGFNKPKVFQELMKIPNIEVRVLKQSADFHAKGYLFDKKGYQSLIIGSSNLTSGALVKNYEWNLRLTSMDNSDLTKQVSDQINQQWEQARPLTSNWIEQYTKYYVDKTTSIPTFVEDSIDQTAEKEIVPNSMQLEALNSLQKIREDNKSKALIISATGTGKTYLGAFDVKQANPQRFLFIVHREQILNKALDSFHKVIGGSLDDYGILSGNSKDVDKKYLFATIQSISKEDNLKEFDRQEFDYILIDEAHKSGADSYRRVVDYFEPEFLLGMTATPERTDDFNIYQLFDYNIAYEIRLQSAIEEDMLSQFHYIGVTDYEYNGEEINELTELKNLVSEERMNYVEQQINYYGHSGSQTSGLIFCSRKDEAKEIAVIMNNHGYKAVALTNEDSISVREATIKRFEQGDLEYIVTVDIFNEGIDIPRVNQIIMLRNTQSSIVFIQQLGRGLRKYKGKEFVTIIDFIGNYKNNYLIPIALTGDKSRNKNSLRSKLATNQLIGLSAINFSEIAKQKIYDSINSVNLTAFKQLRDEYYILKDKLGRIPNLSDFLLWGSIDPQVIVDKYNNYYGFLRAVKENIYVKIEDEVFLNLISKEFMNGKRVHELLLLQKLFKNNGRYSKNIFIEDLKNYGTYTDGLTITSYENNLNLSYFSESDQNKYGSTEYVDIKDDNYVLDEGLLNKEDFVKDLIMDVIEIGLEKSKSYKSSDKLTIGMKYTRRDVNRLLGWDREKSSSIYGYKQDSNTCPIFVTYKKSDKIVGKAKYDNTFYNASIMKWFTRAPRKLNSKEVRSIVDGNKAGTMEMFVFIKKSDDEGTDFYCLGNADIIQESVEQTTMPIKGIQKDIVAMNLKLRTPMDYSLYLNIIG